MLGDLQSRRPPVVTLVAVALLAYALLAITTELRWVSGLLAGAVAWLLWHRHRRARFAAYVFLSGVGVRSAVGGALDDVPLRRCPHRRAPNPGGAARVVTIDLALVPSTTGGRRKQGSR